MRNVAFLQTLAQAIFVTVSGNCASIRAMARAEDRQSKPRATIREVASAAGVSIATVSRVLNGRPDVAPETREAVLRVVRDHGFSSALAAAGVLPDPSFVREAGYAAGAGDEAAAALLDLPDRPTAIFAFND